MNKYLILLPLHHNDGSAIPEAEIQQAIDELYVLAGGYTLEGQVKGAYRMKSGKKQEDDLIKIAVMIEAQQELKLRNLVMQFCHRFDQECIWFERTNSDIELIEPAEGERDE